MVLPMDITRETARLVGDAIEASGKSITDIATATALPRQTLSRRLTGIEKPFTTTEIYLIAGVLGVPATSLLPAAFKDAA